MLIALTWSAGSCPSAVIEERLHSEPGQLFPVSFTDIQDGAGLRAPLTSGSETAKKYIIEANGTGVAFVDYGDDGWLDVFLVNGSRFEPAPDQQELTSRLDHNERNG